MKKLLLVLVCSLLCFGTVNTKAATMNIPEDAVKYDGHTYYVFHNQVSWETAKTSCEAKGGHLVTITSAGEQEFVFGLAREKMVYAWTGAYFNSKSSEAAWVTGEKMDYVPGDAHLPYSSNKYGDINYNGVWDCTNDYSYNYRSYFICEWDTSTENVLPAQVTGVKVSKTSSTSATVTWKKVAGAKGYAVYMKTGKNGTYEKIADITDKTQTSTVKKSLKKGTTYYFQVRAFKNIYGERSYGELSTEKKYSAK